MPDYGYGGECLVARHHLEVAKHFGLLIEDDTLRWARHAQSIHVEAALDGIDTMRTSVATDRIDGPECVRGYKTLANVERAFRSLKAVDRKVRPITCPCGSCGSPSPKQGRFVSCSHCLGCVPVPVAP